MHSPLLATARLTPGSGSHITIPRNLGEKSTTITRSKKAPAHSTTFAARLGQIVAEYGSRYALAKASGLPESTLQAYVLGTKPGMDALVKLARTANVDLSWLLNGTGEMRPRGVMAGAAWADIVVVDQHDFHASPNIPIVISRVPFSRHYLERTLRLEKPSHETLLVVEAPDDLLDLRRGDLVLIDRNQADLSRDGVYLLNLPGFALRGITRRPGGRVGLVETNHQPRSTKRDANGALEMDLSDLVGDGRHVASRIVGRAVWSGRPI